MNITISKKTLKDRQSIQRHSQKKSQHLRSVQNQQSHTKMNYPQTLTEPSEMDLCSKWLLEKCLTDSKQFQTHQLNTKKCSHIRLTKVVHNLNSKYSNRESFKSVRERKITVFSNQKQGGCFNSHNMQQLRLKLQNSNKISLFKDVQKDSVRGEEKSDMLRTKQCTGVNPSMANSQLSSLDKIKDTIIAQIIQRPSTLVSSQKTPEIKQFSIEQSNREIASEFGSGRATDLKQNQLLNDYQCSQESKQKQDKKQQSEDINSIKQDENDLNISFSNYTFSNASNQVNNSPSAIKSINTQHLKRKIDFSEVKPNKISIVRFLDEDLCLKDGKIQQTITSPQRKQNKQSRFIRTIKISQESALHSRFLNLDQSFVLQKGLIEIFNHNFNQNTKAVREKLLNQKFRKSKLLTNVTQQQDQRWKHVYLHSKQANDMRS